MIGKRFNKTIDGIGDFVFRDKTFRDQVKIESLASETLGRQVGQLRPDESNLALCALAYAHLAVLTVDAPPGWNVDSLDPLAPDDGSKLLEVYGGLSEELARFRGQRHPAGTSPGAGA